MSAYVRYRVGKPEGTAPADARWGVVEGEVVAELAGPPFDGEERTGHVVDLERVRLLAPTTPSKVLAVGLNFRSHLGDREAPSEPGLFAKLPTSIIGPGQAIEIPVDAEVVHAEGELVVVMGKPTRNVSPEEARERVFGVTAGNDVSERTWQRDDLQWLRAKGSDSFGPLGPRIVTGTDYDDLLIQTRLNGKVVQSERTSDLIFPIGEIVSYVSRYVTLLPGDVIYTGTPGSTAALSPGDRVEVELEGVGILANPVVGP